MGWARTLVATCAVAAVAVSCSGTEPSASQTTEPPTTVATSVTVSTSVAPVVDEPAEPSTTSTVAASTSTTSTVATRNDLCVGWNATRSLVDIVGDDFGVLDFDQTGVQLSENVDGTDVIRVEYGQIGRVEAGDWMPYTDSDDAIVRWLHTQLHANHRRTIAALYRFVGLPFEMSIQQGVDPSGVQLGIWDGETLTLDGEPEPLSVLDLLPWADVSAATLDMDARIQAWRDVDEWVEQVEPVPFSGLEGLTELREMDLESIRSTFCTLLDTEWRIADIALTDISTGDTAGQPDIFYRELALHELLLLTEYFDIIQQFMERPDVDWMTAEAFDPSFTLDGETTHGEFLAFFQTGAGDALWRHRTLTDLAPIE